MTVPLLVERNQKTPSRKTEMPPRGGISVLGLGLMTAQAFVIRD
jgi:hypothetical protein